MADHIFTALSNSSLGQWDTLAACHCGGVWWMCGGGGAMELEQVGRRVMEQKNITRKDVVDAVFNWRIANKVSQAGLAKRIKVSQAFINKVEKGIKSPSDKFTLGAIDVMEGK